jgi:tRNA U34 5-methylaminomethyl-2-thiouridine-forming methyltransferase MnmC
MNLSVIHTQDGSSTIYNKDMDQAYHSTHGAVSESVHVFIENGLARINKKCVNVLEIGFGSGLNAFLTAIYAIKNQININYHCIEKYPVPIELIAQLNYSQIIGYPELFNSLHSAPWDISVHITQYFKLVKYNLDLLNIPAGAFEEIDIIYFDAFSPSKQSDLWTTEQFTKLNQVLKPDGALVTYSAAGLVKNALRESGFSIKRLQGPPGKHHMVVAKKVFLQ